MSYHRWHAPISGTIVKTYVEPGAYYSMPLFVGLKQPEDPLEDGVVGQPNAQSYLSAMATRAIIFIQADNPAIGLMAFLGVGMADVSTCETTVAEGQHVKKGQEIGMFHYGGSTYCLLFRKDTNVQGFPQPGAEANIPVQSQIAVISGRKNGANFHSPASDINSFQSMLPS